METPKQVLVATDVVSLFSAIRNKDKGVFFQRFFKTGPGQYAHGDIFWGITVPQTRKIVAQCKQLPLTEIEKLMHSPVHEIRLCGLLTLVQRYKKEPQKTFALYVKNLSHVNNWDLVDLSADRIIGAEYARLKKDPIPYLTKLAHSKNLWERRISILATFFFIKNGDANPTLTIASLLQNDPHDLIHKAVGWMLREVGKRCSHAQEKAFIEDHAATMPRTMLRYAIEHFSPAEKIHFMKARSRQVLK